jgi:SAM-dependent methyltransferase
MAGQATFNAAWDELYRTGRHVNRYPWDVVVSFAFRYRPRDREISDTAVLELGCGTGSNLWFLAREGFRTAGVDGSAVAIDHSRRLLQQDGLEADLRVADFTTLPFESESFHLVIDRGSVTCVGRTAARRAVDEARRVLTPGGRFLLNVYSDRDSSTERGTPSTDGLTDHIVSGPLADIGPLCFYDRESLEELIGSGWRRMGIQHLEIKDETDDQFGTHAEWRAYLERPA